MIVEVHVESAEIQLTFKKTKMSAKYNRAHFYNMFFLQYGFDKKVLIWYSKIKQIKVIEWILANEFDLEN